MKKIPLTQGKFALVDDRDFLELSKFKWFAWEQRGVFYALRNSREKLTRKRTIVRMHRAVFPCLLNQKIDHKDGDGLNNQRSNLRISMKCGNNQNARKRIDNTVGLKGVYFHKQCHKFGAQIQCEGKRIHLGLFLTPEEAHAAYCAAAEKLHGEFARFA